MGSPEATRSTGAADHGWIGSGVLRTRASEFPFTNSGLTGDTATRLRDLLVFNGAVEAFLRQMHGVAWYRVWKGVAMAGAGAPNQVVLWEALREGTTSLFTGSSETVYGLCAIDLKRDGPVVVEAPPTLLGGMSDLWQREIMGIGPTGCDQGKGGKFLLLPPDHEGPVPDGHIAARSQTYCVVFGVRSFRSADGADPAVSVMKATRIYPLTAAANPPATIFVNGSGPEIDKIFPDSGEYFEDLAWMIEREPRDTIPSHERFQLAAIGIEKGKAFSPDAPRKALFDDAARCGAMACANTFDSDAPARLVYSDRRWESPFIGGSASWNSQGDVNTDRRAGLAHIANGVSPAMVEKQVGTGSQYLWTLRDASGALLDGGKRYRLHVPADIPVKNFWSVVSCDSDRRSILSSGQRFPSVSTYTAPATNPDGSIDINFGPAAPAGTDSGSRNWIQTTPAKGWFVLFRFYGPLAPFFDQSWKPGDIVEIR